MGSIVILKSAPAVLFFGLKIKRQSLMEAAPEGSPQPFDPFINQVGSVHKIQCCFTLNEMLDLGENIIIEGVYS